MALQDFKISLEYFVELYINIEFPFFPAALSCTERFPISEYWPVEEMEL